MKFAKTRKNQKKLHIVLDLDNTLISSFHESQCKTPDFDFKIDNERFFVYKRPYLNLFLREIFNNAKSVSVWTAASRGYCNKILKHILSLQQRSKLRFIWSRNKTVCKDQACYLKDMSKVFAAFRNMNENNTFLLDDNKNHLITSPYNVECIKPWSNPRHVHDAELVRVLNLFKS